MTELSRAEQMNREVMASKRLREIDERHRKKAELKMNGSASFTQKAKKTETTALGSKDTYKKSIEHTTLDNFK